MANGSTEDKARKARNKADDAKYGYGEAGRIANKVAKTATGKDLTYQEEERAAKIIYGRRVKDTARTAARANFIERRTAKKASSDRIKAAVGGGATPKKQTPKPAIKKVAAKPKTIGTGPNKAKVTPMSPANKNAKGLPKTGRQNVKKSGKK
jgi:glucan-binding YG repeat protein